MAVDEVTKPTGVKAFGAAVRKKIYDNIVGSVAAAILAIAATAALVAWNPLKNRVDDSLADLKNIKPEEALRIARSTVGSRTIWAVPFRNRDDDNQYIAVWYERDYRNDPCEGEKAPAPGWCELGLGPIDLDILVGNEDTYERQRTHVTSGTSAGGMDPEYLATITKASGQPLLPQWGVVDRDGDGRKEVLSVADSTGTAPTLPVYVSLYETATGQVRQLRSFPSRFSVKNEFYNVGSSAVRAWLIARLAEFRDNDGDICRRDSIGKLTCTVSAALNKEQAENKPRDGAVTAEDRWRWKNEEDWVATNGVDFTRGPIKLIWSAGRSLSDGDCTGRTGNLEWRNAFKGPLIVNDLRAKRKAVAYLQDGDHHREIPAVIFGKRYVWLALAVDKAILAIDPATFELKRFDVPEFASGIPQSWVNEGKPREMVSDEEITATKDFQLDELTLANGRLAYGDLALSLSVPADEFTAATQCPRY